MSALDKSAKPAVFTAARAHDWTPERIAKLSAQEIKQLRANAERLNEPELAALCDRMLTEQRRAQAAPRRKAEGKATASAAGSAAPQTDDREGSWPRKT